jgi:hypothetical protein
MSFPKRERESEEDVNERVAKALAATEPVQRANAYYFDLSEEERRRLGSRGFANLPQDVQKLIASMNVGVLMNMAMTSRLFADLARQDWLWKRCFERDYPKEFVFCRGELPFFVLDKTHPYWKEGEVKPEDEPAWKRFYLNVADEYRKKTDSFMTRFQHFFKSGVIPQINLKWANSRDIYQWFNKIVLSKHHPFYDLRAHIAWVFVVALVWHVKEPGLEFEDNDVISAVFYNFVRENHQHWLLPYLSHSNPEGVVRNIEEIDFDSDLIFDPNDGRDGPSAALFYNFLHQDTEFVDLASPWLKYVTENPPWQNTFNFFSKKDEQKLEDLLNMQRGNSNFRIVRHLEEDSVFDKRSQTIMWIWRYLTHCHQNPCLFTFDTYITLHGPLAYNARELRNIPSMYESLFVILRNDVLIARDWNPFFTIRREGLHISLIPYSRDLLTTFMMFSELPRHYYTGQITYIQSSCVSCGVIPKNPQRCGGSCKDVSTIFCGVECQTKHWKAGHNKKCTK